MALKYLAPVSFSNLGFLVVFVTLDILNCAPAEHRVDHRGAGRHLPAAGPHAQGAGGNDGEIGGMYRVALAV